jgi:hypothetical protein
VSRPPTGRGSRAKTTGDERIPGDAASEFPERPSRNGGEKSAAGAPKRAAGRRGRSTEAESGDRAPGAEPVLLSGGNPQIAKGDGEGPVQAYLASMPGWKREVGVHLDALIARTVPGVRKAVRWNSPFYGLEDQGWFLSFHCFTRYVKVTFFRGASLNPLPPGESKQKDVRYLDIHEGERVDVKQLAEWIRQVAALPGWVP